LDKDSHWLLLLTDDPKLVNEYEHPKNKIEKTYIIQINKPFAPSDIKKCLIWILDEGEKLKISKLEIISKNKLQIILTEWKKRHIRRIMQSLWYHVLDLQRISEWKFSLWNLKIGEWKLINITK
jgi:23S rRNA pseudouridine2605 synthase